MRRTGLNFPMAKFVPANANASHQIKDIAFWFMLARNILETGLSMTCWLKDEYCLTQQAWFCSNPSAAYLYFLPLSTDLWLSAVGYVGQTQEHLLTPWTPTKYMEMATSNLVDLPFPYLYLISSCNVCRNTLVVVHPSNTSIPGCVTS